MQSYPSPNAMAADNGGGPFYQTPSSTQPPPLSNSEELQLTAQLTRGLAPARNNTGAAGNIIGGQEQAASRNMNHQYENAGPHAIELRSPNDSMDQMNMQFSTPDRPADLSKQRTKVSRACDECRRKKIKCDAQGEGPNDVCSNCVRVKTTCLFTRLPMKRGPSKGYVQHEIDLEKFVNISIRLGISRSLLIAYNILRGLCRQAILELNTFTNNNTKAHLSLRDVALPSSPLLHIQTPRGEREPSLTRQVITRLHTHNSPPDHRAGLLKSLLAMHLLLRSQHPNQLPLPRCSLTLHIRRMACNPSRNGDLRLNLLVTRLLYHLVSMILIMLPNGMTRSWKGKRCSFSGKSVWY
jgi:hypothetical protein